MNSTTALPIRSFRFTGGWLADRIAVVRDVMLPYQWEALNDQLPDAEPSGCIQNLRIAAGQQTGAFRGMFWQDSDLAKWLEAVSYRLGTDPDAGIEATVDEVVALLEQAQCSDGYLNTYFQVAEPGKRFTNLRDCHELYCAGHLIEAAVAHFQATGKSRLIEIATRLADMLVATFGPGEDQIRGYCGHEEIELALVKLGRATGDRRYIDLAAWFLEERGTEPNYFKLEAVRRGETQPPWYTHFDQLAYWQAHARPRDQTEPVGHAVRATYLYSAMADVALEKSDERLAAACHRLWDEVEQRHLYVTGGIGADGPGGEKFSEPYDLPSDRAYSETCAAVGLVFFARRMLDLDLDARFADTMERALYNNVLAGVSLDGRRFFYVNPLEVRPREAARRYDCRHVKSTRQPWFACACCPPNIARLLASLGDYAVSRRLDGLNLHLYASGEVHCPLGDQELVLRIETDYPWSGTVSIHVTSEHPVRATLGLRIPSWSREPTIRFADHHPIHLNGPLPANSQGFGLRLDRGYLTVSGMWIHGLHIVLDLPMQPERVRAHPRAAALAGQVALQRGPVVYAFEEVDNGAGLARLSLPRESPIISKPVSDALGSCTVLETVGRRLDAQAWGTELYRFKDHLRDRVPLRAVPYALWANRGEGEMRVWLRES